MNRVFVVQERNIKDAVVLYKKIINEIKIIKKVKATGITIFFDFNI